MSRIALYHLETLLWISRLGTFGAAAERLNTTQPAVSARVRELEEHVGAKLFRREGRRMLLTLRGRELVQRCEPLWNELRTTLLAAEGFASASGIVRIGCGEIAAALWLPDIIAMLKRELPRVTLEVSVDLTIDLYQKVEAGLLDVCLLVGPADSPRLIRRSLGKLEMAWYSARTLEAGRPSGQDVLASAAWCLSKPSHLYQVMVDYLRDAGLGTNNVNTCNNVRTLIDIVASGAGVGILPTALVKTRPDADRLVTVDVPVAPAPIEFLLVMRRADDEPLISEIYRRIGDAIVGDS
ncbi:HTH-type transcriptional regulator GltR [Pandoraea captiosa]|uniref:HTH-type transcriptional regulator GltR n=1 Tax=Pandoraea captiosa TaxID=2508302 RepID=A0A5E4ZIM0_9BURK|nr:LysR family transcriptional regulator [Pandoraea captiosa]VVE61271.1 HTH-type transcriptional regulator GltR [Pandoraea captiosa]